MDRFIRKYKYEAFISYRHFPEDSAAAGFIHNCIETYRFPKGKEFARQTSGKRRIFLDVAQLGAVKELGPEIYRALEESRYLIVVCSRSTPCSQWISNEVNAFIESGRGEKIIAVLIEGTEEEAFPPPLLEYRKRETGVTMLARKPVRRNLKKIKLKLLSLALEIDYENLRKAHNNRLLKTRLAITALILPVVMLFGVFSIFQLHEKNRRLTEERDALALAEMKRDEAQEKENVTLSAVYYFTSLLPEKLEYRREYIDRLDEVLDENIELLDNIIKLDEGAANTREQLFKHMLLSLSCRLRNESGKALEYGIRAADIAEELSGTDGDESMICLLAEIYTDLGRLKYKDGNYNEARAFFMKSLEVCKRPAAAFTGDKTAFIAADACSGIGVTCLDLGSLVDSISFFNKSIAVYGSIERNETNERKIMIGLYRAYGNLARVTAKTGELAGACKHFERSNEICRSLIRGDSDSGDEPVIKDLASSLSDLAMTWCRLDDLHKALLYQQEAIDIYVSLIIMAGDDEQDNKLLAGAYHNLAEYNLLSDNPEAALEASGKAMELDPDNPVLLVNLAHGYLLSGQYEAAMDIYIKNLDIYLFNDIPFREVVLRDLQSFMDRGIDSVYIKKAYADVFSCNN